MASPWSPTGIGVYLCCFTGDRPKSWLRWLPWVEFCYNTSSRRRSRLLRLRWSMQGHRRLSCPTSRALARCRQSTNSSRIVMLSLLTSRIACCTPRTSCVHSMIVVIARWNSRLRRPSPTSLPANCFMLLWAFLCHRAYWCTRLPPCVAAAL